MRPLEERSATGRPPGDGQRLPTKHGIELFGGLGYTWENDIQLYVKRAKAGDLLSATTKDHRAQ